MWQVEAFSCSILSALHWWCLPSSAVSSCALLSTGAVQILERAQQRATKVIKGLKHLSHKEMLGHLGWLSLEQRILRCISVFINGWREGAKRIERFFRGAQGFSEATGADWNRRFCLSIRKAFAVRVAEHWHQLSREGVEVSCLAILRSILVLHG